MFGPTKGDRIRLADTALVIEVEKDFTTYGEEVKFGGGKVVRDGMGQSQLTNKQGAVDTVITNVLILDHWGIVKADVALKDGKIHAIGKDNLGGFSAAFGLHHFHVRLCGVSQHELADLSRACERYHVHVLMESQGSTHGLAQSRHHVQYALRKAGLQL